MHKIIQFTFKCTHNSHRLAQQSDETGTSSEGQRGPSGRADGVTVRVGEVSHFSMYFPAN